MFYGTEPRRTQINALAPISEYIGDYLVISSRHLYVVLRNRAHGSPSFVSSILTGFLESDVSNEEGDVAWLIASAFQIHEDLLRPPRPPRFESPLAAATDKYLNLIESEIHEDDRNSLEMLKHHALNNFLIPILNHARTDKQSRARALLVVGYI